LTRISEDSFDARYADAQSQSIYSLVLQFSQGFFLFKTLLLARCSLSEVLLQLTPKICSKFEINLYLLFIQDSGSQLNYLH